MEVRRQINQNLMFNTLDKLPFIPLFLYPPIRLFYVNMISATAAVFESGTGYMIKLAIILSSFIGYYILTTINNASVARTDDRLLFIVNMMHDTRVELIQSVKHQVLVYLPTHFHIYLILNKSQSLLERRLTDIVFTGVCSDIAGRRQRSDNTVRTLFVEPVQSFLGIVSGTYQVFHRTR